MDMELATVHDYGLFPWPARLVLTLAFLVGAVVVAKRNRPTALAGYWAATTVAGVALALALQWPLEWRPVAVALTVIIRVAIPTGLTCLSVGWLAHLTRRRKAMLAAGVAAVVSFIAGLFLAGFVSSAVLYGISP